jgi:flagellar basal-body rod modification protein FlgD
MSLDLAALGLRATAPQSAAQTRSTGRGTESLGQQDFLTLLVTQLKNQDPLNPLDNEAFVAQLAQFSTVSGITEMNASLKALTARAGGDSRSSAPQWIGRTVTAEDGAGGNVRTVGFAPDGSLLLNLDSGASLPVSAITSVA